MEKEFKFQIRGTAGKIADGELKIESQGKTKWKYLSRKKEKKAIDNDTVKRDDTAQKEVGEEDEEIIR